MSVMYKTSEATLSRRRKVLFSLIIFSLTVLIMVAVTELGFRYVENPRKLPLFKENPNGTNSHRLRPNLRIITQVNDETISIETNSHGMHWREVDKNNSQDKVRVAFVGDSFTFGFWAKDFQSTFVGIFEQSLPRTYESLNFGVGGYGFTDIELLLKEEVTQFHPKYVILASYNGNDFKDTYFGLKRFNISDGTARVDSRIVEQKVPSEHRQGPVRAFLRKHSAAYRALSRLKKSLLDTHDSKILTQNSPVFIDKLVPSKRFTSRSFWSRTPYPPVAEKAREISLQTLKRIKDFLHTRNVTLLIVSIPYRAQVFVEKMSGKGYNIELPQKYIETCARSNAVPYLDLLPYLREHVRVTGKNIFVPGDIHLNTHGHKVVGETIADWFKEIVGKEN